MTRLFSDIKSLQEYFAKKSQKYKDTNIDILPSSELKKILRISIAPELLSSLKKIDLSKPYGRHVIYQDNMIEIMIATWTQNVMCAPHDHGGSWSAITVLQGSASHHLYQIFDDSLQLSRKEHCHTKDLIQCGPHQIHAMGDAGLDSQNTLMTLHAYSQSIPFMMVYDIPRNRSLQVDGSCGAWLPENPSQILQIFEETIPTSHLSETSTA
jgi:cysteine dioxygenase